jgi:DNA modification methylase
MRDLYYGDNLEILQRWIPDQSVDLVYLDPPFNSQRAYNLRFQNAQGESSEAQVTAFEDTWAWGEQAAREFDEIVRGPRADVARLLTSLKAVFGTSALMAYLVMMAGRLVQIHRVLKPTGSLYLHCDASASHYLKVLLDVVFASGSFRNEIVWHYYNKYSAGRRSFARNFDQILFYTKSGRYVFHPLREKRDHPVRQLLRENVNGVLKNRKDEAGKVIYREVSDKKVDAVWRIPCLQPASREMLGYPTQKPLALLERILLASSNEGDVVLDPFCGCGTAIHAAEKLKRQWIGIDVTHLAIGVVERRLRAAFPQIAMNIHGVPRDLEGARDLAERDKIEFRHWACWLVNARSQSTRRGPDKGIDGVIYFQDDENAPKKAIVSVKGGQRVGLNAVRELIAVRHREHAELGLLVTLAEPSAQMRREALEAGRYTPRGHPHGIPRIQILTVGGLLSGREQPQIVNISPAVNFRPPRVERAPAIQEALLLEVGQAPRPRADQAARKTRVVRLPSPSGGRKRATR